jgi:hypothetical protein
MRSYRLVLIPVILVVGLLTVVLAHDVRSWRDAVRNKALEYSVDPGRAVPLRAPTVLPAGVSRWLVSVGRDREWFDALQKFTFAYRTTENLDALGPGDFTILNSGKAALGKVTQDPDPARASQAYNLLAVLAFRQAYTGTDTDPTLIQEAVSDLQHAIHLNQANERAKENLELAFRALTAGGRGAKQPTDSGVKATKNRLGGHSPVGVGY